MKNKILTAWAPESIFLVPAVFAIVVLSGCSATNKGEFSANQPPNVWLSSAPPEGSTEKYTIQLFWGGWDPDGEIAYYEYAITNNDDGPFDPADTTGAGKWHKVFGNDSIFTFTADQLADSNAKDMVTEFRRSHTFFIRAVDREGLASPRPAYRSFTAMTLSPRITVTVPRGNAVMPSLVPPVTTFKWIAEDYIDDMESKVDPDSVSWILVPTSRHNNSYDETTEYIRNLPVDSPEWGDWVWYRAPKDSGRSWTTPPLDFEPYVFAVRAKDEAGAITPVFDAASNIRRMMVSHRSTGPLFTVKNMYLGTVTTAICHEPVTIMDLPAGLPLEFCWEATAEHYGGIVAGYRYGWDIDELTDPDQWEVDYTAFTASTACSPTRTFFFGSHVFAAEVTDNSGYCSRIEIKINVIPFEMSQNVLVVDDYNEGTVVGWEDPLAPGVTPNDEQHDRFWEDMLGDMAGFEPRRDVLQVKEDDVIPLLELARYKSIIWSVYGHVNKITGPVLHDYIRYRPASGSQGAGGKRLPNVLALFLAAGGHLLICGNHPVSLVINPDISIMGYRFPIIFAYELEGGQETAPNEYSTAPGKKSFAYEELCLETMDFSYIAFRRQRIEHIYCSVYGTRLWSATAQRDNSMRVGIPLDENFPLIELREEATGVGREYNENDKGWEAEVYNPEYFFDLCRYVSGPRGCFQPIYGLGCLNTSEPTYGAPVAFWTSSRAHRIADTPGSVGARSAVFGFPPVYFKPDQVRGAIEAIVYGEWQLPRK